MKEGTEVHPFRPRGAHGVWSPISQRGMEVVKGKLGSLAAHSQRKKREERWRGRASTELTHFAFEGSKNRECGVRPTVTALHFVRGGRSSTSLLPSFLLPEMWGRGRRGRRSDFVIARHVTSRGRRRRWEKTQNKRATETMDLLNGKTKVTKRKRERARFRSSPSHEAGTGRSVKP